VELMAKLAKLVVPCVLGRRVAMSLALLGLIWVGCV